MDPNQSTESMQSLKPRLAGRMNVIYLVWVICSPCVMLVVLGTGIFTVWGGESGLVTEQREKGF